MAIHEIGNAKNSNFITQFFKEFNNESLVWVGYLWQSKRQANEFDYLSFINNLDKLESIKINLKKDFLQAGEDDLADFLEECQRFRKEYAPIEDLKFLDDNHRLCWFLINQLERKYDNLRRKRYHFEKPYLSVLFLIHCELKDEKIEIEDIRQYTKELNGKENPKFILKNYIDNKDFISWAVEYTKNKHRSRAHPRAYSINFNEELAFFLGFWDDLYIYDKYRYLVKINQLKKAWQQKEFRDKGATKKAYHLPLTKKSKQQLTQLAEFKDLSEAKVLEKIIELAYRTEMCDKDGKPLY